MRLLQHKREAWWFYRFLSRVYDRVNPLFWTAVMREAALDLAALDDPGLRVLDVGAGTGFTTEGVVARVQPERVVMLDQSPHQLERARRRPALALCRRTLGDAERLPFGAGSFDRWISAGSVEYWPDPQRAVDEAFRVLRPGGVALLVGPVPPERVFARRLADLWMLFPPESDYRSWFEAAGFEDVRVVRVAPDWVKGAYAVAIAGRRPEGAAARPPRAAAAGPDEAAPAGAGRRALVALRFVVGSLAGFVWVPVAVVLSRRRR